MPDPTSAAVRGKSIPRASLHTVEADDVRVFYRQAGPADAPVLPAGIWVHDRTR